MGDASASYVNANSIHHAYQRAAAIAGSNGATVSRNFGYRIRGHAFFISDGSEQGNVIEENLVVATMSSPAGLYSDRQPAGFWTASPTNTWRHNRAVSSSRRHAQLKFLPSSPTRFLRTLLVERL